MLPEIKSSPFCPRCLPYWLTWTPSTLPAFEIVSKQFFCTKTRSDFFLTSLVTSFLLSEMMKTDSLFFVDGLWFHFWVIESWHLVSICWIFHVYLLYTLKLQANVPSNVHMHVVERQETPNNFVAVLSVTKPRIIAARATTKFQQSDSSIPKVPTKTSGSFHPLPFSWRRTVPNVTNAALWPCCSAVSASEKSICLPDIW